ncbi:MAG: hypothetical protein WCE80_13440, partial [Acidimicrobiia bacterium]
DLGATIENGDVGADQARVLVGAGAPAITNPGETPTVIVHGDTDQVVPVQRSVRLADQLGLTHHRTGCGHFSLIDPASDEWAWAVDRMRMS